MNTKSSSSKCNVKASLGALVSGNNDRFYLSDDVNIIGRDENALICIKDTLVSRKHCIIEKLENNRFTICDVSLKGTFVNRKKLVKHRPEELKHRDIISFETKDNYRQEYLFLYKKTLENLDRSEYFDCQSQIKEEIVNLDSSHSIECMKLNKELEQVQSDKAELRKEIMISKLNNQDSLYSKLIKKEEELQKAKVEMELQHFNERNKLEQRWQAELDELKLKLAQSEKEQDRLQVEARKAEQQLADTKLAIEESEEELTRIMKEKDQAETKLLLLTEESTSKVGVVNELKRKLEEKEKEEERKKTEMEKLEENLTCSVCTEIFIEPVVLCCGHMFCKSCIEEWKSKKRYCPICRAKIAGCVQVYNLDSIIEKSVELLSTEAKEQREKLIKQRQPVLPNKKSKSNQKHRTSRNSRTRAPSELGTADSTVRPFPRMVNFPLNRFFGLAEPLYDFDDPFTWNIPEERRPVQRVEPTPVAEIDLTNFFPTVSATRSHTTTATSTTTSGLIDLTTP